MLDLRGPGNLRREGAAAPPPGSALRAGAAPHWPPGHSPAG